MMTKKEFKILEYRVDKIACGMQFYYCDLQPKLRGRHDGAEDYRIDETECRPNAVQRDGGLPPCVQRRNTNCHGEAPGKLCQIPGDKTHWCEPHRLSIV